MPAGFDRHWIPLAFGGACLAAGTGAWLWSQEGRTGQAIVFAAYALLMLLLLVGWLRESPRVPRPSALGQLATEPVWVWLNRGVVGFFALGALLALVTHDWALALTMTAIAAGQTANMGATARRNAPRLA